MTSVEPLFGFDEVKAAADTLNLKQRELEDHRCELHALLLAKIVSAYGFECVVEAVARSSHKASSIPFRHILQF